jgi:hypothetical protein
MMTSSAILVVWLGVYKVGVAFSSLLFTATFYISTEILAEQPPTEGVLASRMLGLAFWVWYVPSLLLAKGVQNEMR